MFLKFLLEILYLVQAVKSETSGHFEWALVTVLNCAENPGKYYAKVPVYIPVTFHPKYYIRAGIHIM